MQASVRCANLPIATPSPSDQHSGSAHPCATVLAAPRPAPPTNQAVKQTNTNLLGRALAQRAEQGAAEQAQQALGGTSSRLCQPLQVAAAGVWGGSRPPGATLGAVERSTAQQQDELGERQN